MRHRPWRRAWTLVLAAFVSGCAAMTASTDNPFAAAGGSSGAYVEILAQNQEDQDVRVYSVIKGIKHELGVVSAYTTASLRVAAPSTGSMRIRVDPLEGLYHVTGNILVRPGDTLDLYITPDPANTYAEVQ